MAKYLNRALKGVTQDKLDENERLQQALEKFYKENPRATRSIARHVEALRKEHESVVQQMREEFKLDEFDKQMKETDAVYMRRELDFLNQYK